MAGGGWDVSVPMWELLVVPPLEIGSQSRGDHHCLWNFGRAKRGVRDSRKPYEQGAVGHSGSNTSWCLSV